MKKMETLGELSERILSEYQDKEILLKVNGKVLMYFSNSHEFYVHLNVNLAKLKVEKIVNRSFGVVIQLNSVSVINTFNLL